MPLHRLTAPTYSGGLPGTHDYINDPAANGDLGVPASADGKKGVGPNEGTYFVAFGENATSLFTNRGMSALAQNTDYLDDVVHRDLAIPVVSALVVPGAPLASVTIPGVDVFVGAFGTSLFQRTLSGLIGVVDGNGIPMHVLNGNVYVPILVSAITDGVSNVVGVPADGFYTTPTVVFSIPIPAGQSYRLVYYKRSTVVGQDAGMLSHLNNGVRGIEDLWALATNTLSGVATFTSGKTFSGGVTFDGGFNTALGTFGIFNGEARFNNPVEFAATAVATFKDQVLLFTGLDKEIPKVLGPSYASSAPTLMYEQPGSGGGTYRVYFGGGGGWTGTGMVVTVNARWDEGPDVWVPDNINDAAIRVSLGLTGGAGVKNHKIDPLPASWVDADWDAGTDDIQYTYGGGYFAAPLPAVIRSTNKTHKVPFLDTFNNALFTAYDYEWFARFSLAFGDRSSMWYSPYKEEAAAGGFAGVSITNNCEWDAVDVRFERQVGTRHSSQVGFNGDDGLLLRKKIPVPTTPSSWLESEWDFVGSLRGMQFSNWTDEELSLAGSAQLVCVAVRPGTATRGELWVYGLGTSSGGGEFARASTPMGHATNVTSSVSSTTSEPRHIVYDEDLAAFYAILTDGVIDTSVDGDTWVLGGNAGVGGPYDKMVFDENGAVALINYSSIDVRTASSVGGVYSTQPTTANFSLDDMIYCRRSGLWIASSKLNFGVDIGIHTSNDLVTWNSVAPGSFAGTPLVAAAGLYALAYNSEKNIVAGFGQEASGVPVVIRSPDGGLTWERVEPLVNFFDAGTGGTNRMTSLQFIGGRFVGVRDGITGVQIVVGSADAKHWRIAHDFSGSTTVTQSPIASRFAASESIAAFVNGVDQQVARSLMLG